MRADDPLPQLSSDERYQALRLMRLVKAQALHAVNVTFHRRDKVLVLEGVPTKISHKCKG